MIDNFTFINCCPTGIIGTKQLNPNVPITVNEIVADSLALTQQGVSMLHLHARDENSEFTYKKEIYKRIIGGIREKNSDVIICVTTSGRQWSDFDKRTEVLDLTGDYKPDMASLTLGSLNFMQSASLNEPKMIEDLSKKMQDNGIKPELEIFDLGMLNQLNILIKKKLVSPPFYVNLLFGNIFSMQLDLASITAVISQLPEKTIAAFAGIGKFQSRANHLGLTLGYGMRVGLEDNLYLDEEKKQLATNVSLVEKLVQSAKIQQKNIASSIQMRKLLEL